MKIFLSHSQADYELANEIRARLASNGNKVVFGHESVPKGKEFDPYMRRQIATCDFFVFLVSPTSVAEESYCRTELRHARRRWPNPEGRVMSVLIAPTPFAQVPGYVRAAPIFAPKTDLVAGLAAEVERYRQQLRAGRVKVPIEEPTKKSTLMLKRFAVALIVLAVLRWLAARLVDFL